MPRSTSSLDERARSSFQYVPKRSPAMTALRATVTTVTHTTISMQDLTNTLPGGNGVIKENSQDVPNPTVAVLKASRRADARASRRYRTSSATRGAAFAATIISATQMTTSAKVMEGAYPSVQFAILESGRALGWPGGPRRPGHPVRSGHSGTDRLYLKLSHAEHDPVGSRGDLGREQRPRPRSPRNGRKSSPASHKYGDLRRTPGRSIDYRR